MYLIKKIISKEIIAENLISNNENIGGEVIFLGKVRADKFDDKIVRSLEYSAYESMAEKKFENVKNIILQKYSDIKEITILHRIGIIKINEIALMVILKGGHRKQAFKGMDEIVNLIKEKVPIWKKEIF
ncbi:MAG: hypothetical protein B6I24_09250 [Bacteroidetes bacterium 4572_128]|nr:MAG: hypothetical protein B6I24_09250 [Bacteroidetes bacterium 4572_128]